MQESTISKKMMINAIPDIAKVVPEIIVNNRDKLSDQLSSFYGANSETIEKVSNFFQNISQIVATYRKYIFWSLLLLCFIFIILVIALIIFLTPGKITAAPSIDTSEIPKIIRT